MCGRASDFSRLTYLVALHIIQQGGPAADRADAFGSLCNRKPHLCLSWDIVTRRRLAVAQSRHRPGQGGEDVGPFLVPVSGAQEHVVPPVLRVIMACRLGRCRTRIIAQGPSAVVRSTASVTAKDSSFTQLSWLLAVAMMLKPRLAQTAEVSSGTGLIFSGRNVISVSCRSQPIRVSTSRRLSLP